MNAANARKLAITHGDSMAAIYERIKSSAKDGLFTLSLHYQKGDIVYHDYNVRMIVEALNEKGYRTDYKYVGDYLKLRIDW